MDLGEATIGYLRGKSIEPLTSLNGNIPNKHHHGGQSSVRFERLRDDAINEYYKRLAEACNIAFLDKNLKGIIIGGPAMTKDDFIAEMKMNHELRKIIIGTVNTSQTDEYGLKEAVNAAQELLIDAEYSKESKIMERFWSELRKENGLCVYGMETISSLQEGRVDTLILSDTFELNVLERFMKCADNFNTKIIIVSKNTENGDMFTKTFKMGGILRFK